MTREIPLTGGMVALVDDGDEALVRGYKWHLVRYSSRTTCYARTTLLGDKPQHNLYMHRLILGAPRGVNVDHADLDGLNNQRNNIRLASDSQNKWNGAKRRTQKGKCPSSRYKGVTWDQRLRKWAAQSESHGRHIHLGLFVSEGEAAMAYNAYATQTFGEFARLNLVDLKD